MRNEGIILSLPIASKESCYLGVERFFFRVDLLSNKFKLCNKAPLNWKSSPRPVNSLVRADECETVNEERRRISRRPHCCCAQRRSSVPDGRAYPSALPLRIQMRQSTRAAEILKVVIGLGKLLDGNGAASSTSSRASSTTTRAKARWCLSGAGKFPIAPTAACTRNAASPPSTRHAG